MECCSVETTDGIIFDLVAEKASDLMYELSGRLFAGSCGPKKVRPYCHGCACGYQVLARGHLVASPYAGYCSHCLVSCSPSLVKLAGYPVRAISEVKINGVVLGAGEYRLHQKRYAMRLNSTRWPLSQNLTLPDSANNTFSITYSYGEDPPEIGIEAASQLACELYKACANLECQLPTGVARIVRQGLVIERAFFQRDRVTGAWRTGLALVDSFLNAYNPRGIMRRPVFFSPSGPQYAQEWE